MEPLIPSSRRSPAQRTRTVSSNEFLSGNKPRVTHFAGLRTSQREDAEITASVQNADRNAASGAASLDGLDQFVGAAGGMESRAIQRLYDRAMLR